MEKKKATRNKSISRRRVFPMRALIWVSMLAIFGCMNDGNAPAKTSTATLAPTTALATRGTVHFTEESGGVRVNGIVYGLPPGVHGFHIHEKGNCDSAGLAAGGHFNPTGQSHGLPDSAMHHMGDLGNLTAGSDSIATINTLFPYLALNSAYTIVGHALIVHAAPDNGGQPTGNAGARISCGVIGDN